MKDFDKDKILQRPFFQDLNLPNCSDDEILATFDVSTLKTSAAIEKRLADLRALDDKLKKYRQYIKGYISVTKAKIFKQRKAGDDSEDSAALLRQLNAIDDAAEILNLQFGKYYVDGEKALVAQYRKEFGRRLRNARLAKNLTQKDVAFELKIPTTTYASYEQGQTEPTLLTLRKLKNFFQLTANDIFGQ